MRGSYIAAGRKRCVSYLRAEASEGSTLVFAQGSCGTGCKGVAKGWHVDIYGIYHRAKVWAWGMRHWLQGIISAQLPEWWQVRVAAAAGVCSAGGLRD